jgi:hypothetical protein
MTISVDILEKLTATILELESSGMVDYVKYGKEALAEIKQLRNQVDSLLRRIEYHKETAARAEMKVLRMREALEG